jgi:hypothetical protein
MYRLPITPSRSLLVAALTAVGFLVSAGTASAQHRRLVESRLPQPVGPSAQRVTSPPARAVTPSAFPTVTAPAAVPVQPVQVAITVPAAPDTAFAAIRGPDGQLRYFPVEGGRAGLHSRVIVVRPGESVTVQLPAPPSR